VRAPLGIASLEDKIVQRALVEVLNAYTSRSSSVSRTAFVPDETSTTHRCAWIGISTKRVKWILDSDLRSYFDTINHENLIAFIENESETDE